MAILPLRFQRDMKIKFRMKIHGQNNRFRIDVTVTGEYLEDVERFKRFCDKNHYQYELEIF